jgi:cyanophycin synthetase
MKGAVTARMVWVSSAAVAPRIPLLAARIDLVRTVGVRRLARRRLLDRRFVRSASARAADVAHALWADAAAELGAELRPLGTRFYEFTLNGATARVSGQSTPLADPVSIRLAEDKALAGEVLARAGIPIPERVAVDGADASAAEALVGAGPCIVKPGVGGGGHAITGQVRTVAQLQAAIRLARTGAGGVVVERMVDGDHYRFLLLDGRLLDVLRRRRPQVVGDGRSTVEELILAEYRRRLETAATVAVKPFRFDLDCVYTLAASGLRLEDVPPAGTAVPVKSASNFGGAADSETYRGPVADALVADVRAAAAALGVRLAGVDVITPDPARSLAEAGGVVLEVNPVPGLMHHYAVASPEEATKVAVPVLEVLLASGQTAGSAAP